MAEDSLHEVQLNGKQLVFLFMVGTVIAVVIFLCGVLVGRGLRPAVSGLEMAAADSQSTIDPTQSLPAATASAPSGRAPVSASETLTYGERLESPASPLEDFSEPARPVAEPIAATPPPPPARPAASAPVAARPAPSGSAPPTPRAASPSAAATSPAAGPEPTVPAAAVGTSPGKGFVVQVMAVNTRGEADAVAKRLTAKGYPAFVTTTGAGAKVTYRVRVGAYDTQREAETVSGRLQKEEQFKPWVTR